MERTPQEQPTNVVDLFHLINSTSRFNTILAPLQLNISIGKREVMAEDIQELREAFGTQWLKDFPCHVRGTAFPIDEGVFETDPFDDSDEIDDESYEEYGDEDDNNYDDYTEEIELVEILDEPFKIDWPNAYLSDIVMTEKAGSNELEIMLAIFVKAEDSKDEADTYYYMPFNFIEKLEVIDQRVNPSEIFQSLTFSLQEQIKQSNSTQEFLEVLDEVRDLILDIYDDSVVEIHAAEFYRLHDEDPDFDWKKIYKEDAYFNPSTPPIRGQVFDVVIPDFLTKLEPPKKLKSELSLPFSRGEPMLVVRNKDQQSTDFIYITSVDKVKLIP